MSCKDLQGVKVLYQGPRESTLGLSYTTFLPVAEGWSRVCPCQHTAVGSPGLLPRGLPCSSAQGLGGLAASSTGHCRGAGLREPVLGTALRRWEPGTAPPALHAAAGSSAPPAPAPPLPSGRPWGLRNVGQGNRAGERPRSWERRPNWQVIFPTNDRFLAGKWIGMALTLLTNGLCQKT